MKSIALNGRFSGTPEPTGTQTVAFQLFDAILREPREPGEFEFVVFADDRFPGVESWRDLPHVRFIRTPFQDWSRGRAQLWEQITAPHLARRHGCSIMHHPITTSPIWQNGLVQLVTLHDLNFYLHPEWYSRSFRMAFALCAIPGLRRSRCVVTISDYIRGQLSEIIGIPEKRLHRIYNGVKPMKSTAPRAGNYLFAAGSLQPHKNLARLMRAFQTIRREYPDLELLIAGRPQPHFASDPEMCRLLTAPGIRLAGYLSEEELANAYAGARAFCFPSLEEGFGLPILEAMTLGCPVLTSNVSCMPEIAGPALLVDPFSVESIAEGLREILNLNPEQRLHLQEEGRHWAARFSWKSAAREYMNLYRKLHP